MVDILFSRARPRPCNGEHRRSVIKAQPSSVGRGYVEYLNKWCGLFYAETYRPTHPGPHTVRGRSTQKDGVCNEHIFRNGSFRELKIEKESHDLPDLAKVLPESYQMNRTENADRMLLQTTAEHLRIKTKCVVYQI